VGRTPKHLSKSTRQQLAEIFKKIGSKEQMQEVYIYVQLKKSLVFFLNKTNISVKIIKYL